MQEIAAMMPMTREPIRMQRAIITTPQNLNELNTLLAEKWEVVSETPVDSGALIILQRDEFPPLVTLAN